MAESDTLRLWDSFYSHFQNSKQMKHEDTEDKPVEIQNAGTSLLLDTGKSFALDLFKGCGLLDNDILKLHHILWQLEEKCLPQIAVMFEKFKKVVDVTNDSAQYCAIIQDNTQCGVTAQESNHSSVTTAQDSTQYIVTAQVGETEDVLNSKEKDESILDKVLKVSDSEKICQKETNTCAIASECMVSKVANSTLVSKKGVKNHSEKLVIANDSEKLIESVLAPVRRSGRSVKITPKFQDIGNTILRTIKPELDVELDDTTQTTLPGHENLAQKSKQRKAGEECTASIKPPLLCSFCKKSTFSSERELLEHWTQHEEVAKGENPFQCSVCKEKCSSFSNLCSHYLQHGEEAKKCPCNVCSEKFGGIKALTKHQRLTGHGEDLTQSRKPCPMCHAVLASTESLEEHMLVHIPCTFAYFCHLCQENFFTLGLLRIHLLSHLGLTVRNHICILCGKTFKLEKFLEAHVRRIHGKNGDRYLFQCPQCPKRFKDKDQLDFHSVRHSGVKPYRCEICGKTFLREKGLISHRRLHDGGGFMCDICGKSFVNQRVLEDHSTVHTGERPYVCDVCGKKFRLRANLRYHKQVHNPIKRIQCQQCPKSFRDSRSYSRHMMMHTGEKPWRCEVCGKGFVQELTLKKHMNLHNGENRHQCKVCLRSFVDKWGLLKHSTIHTGERPYECSVCQRSFRIKKGLEDHFKLHDTSLQLKCPLCPKTFVEKRHLDHHLRVHRGEKAYVCEICGDRFVNSMSLKVHHRRHTGEKPYKCSYCPKTFNQHGTHAAHERFHRGERPFACDFCEAAFITRSQLNIHRRKHLNLRPYKCPQCDYAATTASLLKVHALKHSTEKPFRCSLCPAAFKRQNHLDVHARKHQAREEVLVTAEDNRSIIHISGTDTGTQSDPAAAGTMTVVEMFQCSFCESTFPTQAGLEKHMKRHEIIVVTAAANQDGIFEIPAIEGAHGASSEVAYDIVLL
ncbi:Zinc finger protein 420-like [Plakobranchus ocellatus]|uniref:Zinc finger protein 420-like n=1 Tax=Plakobranchus ocellatus TaxID=259542 RepID=A0AAV4DE52_9GAST|nr:Zinc finger protein 420-like [Plakobranchus ocellatus]